MNVPPLKTVSGQPSWPIRSNRVQAYLTQLGGHLGPITFRLGRKTIAPFSVTPWAEEKVGSEVPAMLRVLRGDFFCAPFGGNEKAWRGEKHPPHGESANARWRLAGIERDGPRTTAHAVLNMKVRRGRLDKFVTLIDGQTAVYQRHVFSGARGPMNVGHHAMLRFPEAAGSGAISTSRIVSGQVYPGVFEAPENRGYQSLQPGAKFSSLERVPLIAGGTTDLTRYPARNGFEDLVMVTADDRVPLAWTAVVFPRERYAWIALRDPRQLRHTIFWISNGGRHYPPWSGRHRRVMGLEDVTSYFHGGLADSASPNPLSRRGIPTAFTLNPRQPTEIRYLMALVAVPAGFDRVKVIRPGAGGVELVATSGRRATCALDLDFLRAAG